MEQWQIRRTAGICAGTGRKLEPDEEYIAALVDEHTHFERFDFSRSYWDEHQPTVYSYWKTRMPAPSQKKRLFVDNDVLLNLFERLADETQPLKVNFRFVLALILMRQRLLAYEESFRNPDGAEIWRLRVVRSPDRTEVRNPNLTEEQIQEVSAHLSTILEGEIA